jgi:hypothetical protein
MQLTGPCGILVLLNYETGKHDVRVASGDKISMP